MAVTKAKGQPRWAQTHTGIGQLGQLLASIHPYVYKQSHNKHTVSTHSQPTDFAASVVLPPCPGLATYSFSYQIHLHLCFGKTITLPTGITCLTSIYLALTLKYPSIRTALWVRKPIWAVTHEWDHAVMMGPENISLHDKKQIRKHIQYWAETNNRAENVIVALFKPLICLCLELQKKLSQKGRAEVVKRSETSNKGHGSSTQTHQTSSVRERDHAKGS